MKMLHSDNLDEITKLLKESDQNFQFDQGTLKRRLLLSIKQTPINPEPGFNFALISRYAAFAICLLLLLTATVVSGNHAQPGDKFFGVHKLGERFILSLPLPYETEAEIHTKIVANRLVALEQIEQQVDLDQLKSENMKLSRVRESGETLNAAIDAISANRQKLETSGQTVAAQHLSESLTLLESLAAEHEIKIELLEAGTDNLALREKIQEHLLKVQQAKAKAQTELNRKKPNTDPAKD